MFTTVFSYFLKKNLLSSKMNQICLRIARFHNSIQRYYSSAKYDEPKTSNTFETVFSFPSIKYVSLINRLKVYHLFGTSLAIPGCGLLESMNIVPSYTFITTAYIGITGAAVLSLGTLPFRNTIGFLYISEDNKKIKISSVDFWGRRNDRIVTVDDWIPLMDLESKPTDKLFLTPRLKDGTKYKLPVRFGEILNSIKMGQVLD